MLTLTLLAGLSLSAPLVAQQEPAAAEGLPFAGNRVDYEIEARYHDETRRLEGSETIRWTNATDQPTSELWFHLYWNAFSNNRTTFALEDGPAHKDEEWGWSRVKSVSVGGVDVMASFEYAHPDSGGATGFAPRDAETPLVLAEDDRTVFRVHLDQPVAPGATAEVEVTWTALVPRARWRTGYKGDFLLMAQWFPKLGVFEGAQGWNCHQFHNHTEFFSDYGSYRVTLDLPDRYEGKIGGSGVLVASRKKDGDRVEVVFEAPSLPDRTRPDMFAKLPVVHDFTWTADPDYVTETFQFSWDEWSQKSDAHRDELERVRAVLGPDAALALRDVDVTVLIHPERRSQALRHFEATANALYFYGLWFGEYPYEHITVVDPAFGAGAGGMEYPTLFTAGTELFTTPEDYQPESVTVHECGHQFWYGLVGNNEFESSWLDEGFNSYTDSEVLIRAYGRERGATKYSGLRIAGVRPVALPGGGKLGSALRAADWTWDFESLGGLPLLDLVAEGHVQPLRPSGILDWWRDQPLTTLRYEWSDPRWADRRGYLASDDVDPIDMEAWLYKDRPSYRTNSYYRTAVALRTLRGVVGYGPFLRGMRHYAASYRYQHPTPDDFFAAFNEGAGVDVSWYFQDAFRSTKTIDWSVSVSQKRVPDKKGWFQVEDGRFRTIKDIEKDAAEVAAESGEVPEAVAAAEPVGEEPDAEAQEDEESEDVPDGTPRLVEITLQRRGELCLPLAYRIVYEDGTSEDRVWTREEQLAATWKRVEIESPSKVTAVVLDPERLYYVDGNMSDNQWYAQGDKVAPLRWTERVLSQYGHLLHWYGSIGG
ncbi:MAG: M1 family metallopeptidase [Planctomycetes bacterium]|nr:M1 family metallopeptidase [Planctomycetota bacterium]